MVTATIAGAGTTEDVWRPWLAAQCWPSLDLDALAGRRVVALAAHPDDEVLGVGGLLAWLAAAGNEIVVAWATDGEASHPESSVITPSTLRAWRRTEADKALRLLGISVTAKHRWGLPDSGLDGRRSELNSCVASLLRPGDVVLAPWRDDGHPDHEAVGAAAASACEATPDVTLLEYPIWMWHWATPDDPRVPWGRAATSLLPAPLQKAAAIDAFETQVRPLGTAAGDAAILPPEVVARFVRDIEVVFR